MSRVVFRNKRHMIFGVVLGLWMAGAAIGGMWISDASLSARILGTVVAGSVGYVLVFRVGLGSVATDAAGVYIRNPLRSWRIPWQQVRGFRIKQAGFFGPVGAVDLATGRTVRIWAIAPAGPLVGGDDDEVVDRIAELNDRLRALSSG